MEAFGNISTLLRATFDQLDGRFSDEQSQGVYSGLSALDEITGGIRPGEWAIIGSRPGEGSSALASQWAVAAAGRGTPTIFLTLQVTAQAATEALLARDARVERIYLRRGQLSKDNLTNMTHSADRLRQLPLSILAPIAPTAEEVVGILDQALVEDRGRTRFVVIDGHSQLRPNSQCRNQLEADVDTCQALSTFARESGCSLLTTSPIKRQARSLKSSQLGSSDITSVAGERLADQVLLLLAGPGEGDPGLLVAKNRCGPGNWVDVQFDTASWAVQSID